MLETESRRRAQFHLNLLLRSDLLVYAFRDLYPLCTYTDSPADAEEGWVLWSCIGILILVAVFLTLITPREYRPIDPLVCMTSRMVTTEHEA